MLANIEYLDDIRVAYARRGLSLTDETKRRDAVARKVRVQNLNGYRTVKDDVATLENGSSRTSAEDSPNLVAAKSGIERLRVPHFHHDRSQGCYCSSAADVGNDQSSQ